MAPEVATIVITVSSMFKGIIVELVIIGCSFFRFQKITVQSILKMCSLFELTKTIIMAILLLLGSISIFKCFSYSNKCYSDVKFLTYFHYPFFFHFPIFFIPNDKIDLKLIDWKVFFYILTLSLLVNFYF